MPRCAWIKSKINNNSGSDLAIISVTEFTGYLIMAPKSSSSRKYHSVDPEDFYNFEDQYQDKGGGSPGKKGGGSKGKKTLQDLKRQQRAGSLHQRKVEIEQTLLEVLDGFPEFESPEKQSQFLAEYAAWVEANLSRLGPLDPAQIEISFSKSGGPGGQNVNKRETKVALRHKPTQIRVVNDQTRSQSENRALAADQLRRHLEDHLRDWKMYLGSGLKIDLELVKELLEREL